MSTEKQFQDSVRRVVGKRWRVTHHQEMYQAGIPDLSFSSRGVNGWIELKLGIGVNKVRCRKFTYPQAHWLKDRQRHGGHCFVLMKAGDDIFLLPADHAHEIAEGQTREWLRDNSVGHWVKRINPDEFIHKITYARCRGCGMPVQYRMCNDCGGEPDARDELHPPHPDRYGYAP